MKNVFIDCGAHTGLSVDYFLKNFPDSDTYEIHSFECSPAIAKDLKKSILKYSNVYAYEAAVWIHNNTDKFYLGNTYSSTLCKEKHTGNIDVNNPIEVQCIRLSDFIQNNFSINDNIILKLDIEGAEYKVLDDLINTNIISYINVLYGEWHWPKISLPKEEHDFLEERLLKYNLKMIPWNAVV